MQLDSEYRVNYALICPENASEPNLKRVAALDGVKVFQIAVGAEHSAVVAGTSL